MNWGNAEWTKLFTLVCVCVCVCFVCVCAYVRACMHVCVAVQFCMWWLTHHAEEHNLLLTDLFAVIIGLFKVVILYTAHRFRIFPQTTNLSSQISAHRWRHWGRALCHSWKDRARRTVHCRKVDTRSQSPSVHPSTPHRNRHGDKVTRDTRRCHPDICHLSSTWLYIAICNCWINSQGVTQLHLTS